MHDPANAVTGIGGVRMIGAARILVVEDDATLARVVVRVLLAEGYEVDVVNLGRPAPDLLATHGHDLVLLDLGLPDIDGVEVLERLRASSAVPVIVLTARDGVADKVRALDAGADDHLTKPFDVDELCARIRVALRRRMGVGPSGPSVLVSGELEIDVVRHVVRLAGEEVSLTPKERGLLETLATHPEQLLTHEFLLRAVWGPEYGVEKGYLRTFVGQLRNKLGDDAGVPQYIATEPGVGYRWVGSRR